MRQQKNCIRLNKNLFIQSQKPKAGTGLAKWARSKLFRSTSTLDDIFEESDEDQFLSCGTMSISSFVNRRIAPANPDSNIDFSDTDSDWSTSTHYMEMGRPSASSSFQPVQNLFQSGNTSHISNFDYDNYENINDNTAYTSPTQIRNEIGTQNEYINIPQNNDSQNVRVYVIQDANNNSHSGSDDVDLDAQDSLFTEEDRKLEGPQLWARVQEVMRDYNKRR